jgi:4-amino-4-deoxy-L-arabinose transferase-like glycosyltransferase
MAEPTPPHSIARPARAGRWAQRLAGLASLAFVLEVALGLRIVAASAVDLYVHGGGTDQLCLFPDTKIYWGLARAIRAGAPYEIVDWSDIPHFAVRTPGYPLFLAACQTLFGERTLAVRLVQAALGTVSVYLAYRLTRQCIPAPKPDDAGAASPFRGPTVPLVAAVLAALNPYYIFISSLILSEAIFVPLLLASVWGVALLWNEPDRGCGIKGFRAFTLAFLSGAAAGAAILVRPSWALYVPAVLAIWMAARLPDRRAFARAACRALICSLGVVAVMGPWWARNAMIYGRFVPTALWMGASLYDGLNPEATGASDMAFLGDREIWPLDEQDKDAELTRRAVAFAREYPGRVLSLAVVKLGRFWSPWPNAEGFRSPVLGITSAVVELPLFGLMALGGWDRRRDLRAWTLLAGPLLYFCALHLIFASSMRYRIPGEMPALGLAAIGAMKIKIWWLGRMNRQTDHSRAAAF